jgi:hypothetical protein
MVNKYLLQKGNKIWAERERTEPQMSDDNAQELCAPTL